MSSCNVFWVSRSPSPASTSYACASRNVRQRCSWINLPLKSRERGKQKLVLCKSTESDGVTVREGTENLVIVGSGPAGYTAAIYAARANLRPVVFEGLQVGGPRGGQLMTTNEVENFPGFPEGITGPDLMDRMRAQAERWGAILITEDVEFLDLTQRPFTIRSSENEARANAIILATGATAKRLGLPSEEKYWSKGISACAICDGSSPAFKEQELAVVGGGDTAAEEAMYLTKYGKKVHLLVRGGKMRASGAMQDRVLSHPNVEVHFNVSVDDVVGDAKGLTGLKIRHSESENSSTLKVKGLFYGIGHQPNSHLFADTIEVDEAGYVKVRDSVKTSLEGVFAAGDLFDKEWRQAVTAAGSGCMAALAAERYLNENDLIQEFHQRPKEAEAAPKAVEGDRAVVNPEDVDIHAAKHQGQIALRKLYHESPRVIVVLYTAKTCGPCRTLKPIVHSVIDEYKEHVHLIEIDIDVDSEVAQAGGVNSTPTVQMFKKKALIQHLPGVKMKREYRRIIEEAIELQQ